MTTPVIPVPSLSSSGWMTSINEKCDFLISHYFVAEKSQTALFGDNIASLPWIIQQYGNDPIACTQKLQADLTSYLSRYFDSASVNATINNTAIQELSGEYGIQVVITVTQQGKEYSLAQLIETSNSKIQTIIRLNNQGT